MKDEYLVQAFVDTTPLEYLIPTTVGAGTCTAALVDFLTQSHNNFIERCRGLTSSQDEKYIHVYIIVVCIWLFHVHYTMVIVLLLYNNHEYFIFILIVVFKSGMFTSYQLPMLITLTL